MANVENASGETPTQVASKPVASNQDETLNVLKDILSLMESVDKQLKNHGARLANIENRALKSENESGWLLANLNRYLELILCVN